MIGGPDRAIVAHLYRLALVHGAPTAAKLRQQLERGDDFLFRIAETVTPWQRDVAAEITRQAITRAQAAAIRDQEKRR